MTDRLSIDDATAAALGEEIAGRSLWQEARARLARNRAAVASLTILAVIALLALFAPLLSPHPFDEVYFDEISSPPNFAKAHWFGTDANGRDLFVRTLYGAACRSPSGSRFPSYPSRSGW